MSGCAPVGRCLRHDLIDFIRRDWTVDPQTCGKCAQVCSLALVLLCCWCCSSLSWCVRARTDGCFRTLICLSPVQLAPFVSELSLKNPGVSFLKVDTSDPAFAAVRTRGAPCGVTPPRV
jgi:hypothetical protein